MNSRFVEYMEFLKLLFAQNARFVSNIPIFPTDIFALILLRVFVRVKIRVNTTPVHQQIVVVAVLEFLVCDSTGIFSLFLRPVRLIWYQLTHYFQIFLLSDFP